MDRDNKNRLKINANTSLSPSLIAKLKIKDTVNKLKNKSPQLQEVLRQRCRERMKSKRGEIFNRRRLGLELTSAGIEDTLSDVMCQEIDNLEKMDWQQPIEKLLTTSAEPFDQEEALQLETELNMDEEQWLFEEYERMLQDEIEWLESIAYEDTKNIICPVCQKCILTKALDSINCKGCGLRLSNDYDLQTVGNLIDDCISRHSINCNSVPGFTAFNENENSSLYMTCEDCSSLKLVV